MSEFIQKLFTSYKTRTDGDTRIGELNRIWYDSETNTFRIQLDDTPGGTIIGSGTGGGDYTLPTASTTVKGGVKIDGTTITINNQVISGFSGNYADLTNTPTIPAAQIQSDWNQTTNTSLDYIKNKPTIPSLGNLSVGGPNLQTVLGSVTDADILITPNGTGSVGVPSLKVGILGSILSSQLSIQAYITAYTLVSIVDYSTTDALPSGLYGNTNGVPAPWTIFELSPGVSGTPISTIAINDVLSGVGIIPSTVKDRGTGTYASYVIVDLDLSQLGQILPIAGASFNLLRPLQKPGLDISTASGTDLFLNTQGTGDVLVNTNILPVATNVSNLGSPEQRWKAVYVGPGTIYVLDETLGKDIAIGARDGLLYIQNGSGLKVGEFTLIDNQIRIADPARDIIIGSSGATADVVFNRSIKIKDSLGALAFEVDRDGITSIYTPSGADPNKGTLNIIGTASGLTQPRGTLYDGTLLHLTAQDGKSSRISSDSFGTGVYPLYAGRAARGTVDAPTASQSGDILSRFSAVGYGASEYKTGISRFDAVAAENFTNSAAGTKFTFQATPTGSIAAQLSTTVDSTGLSFSGAVDTNAGITFRDGTRQTTAATSYTLPTATDTVLGGVKIGSNISITDGVISVAAPFGGSYNDLTDTPTIPDAQVNSDWNASSGLAEILNKPALFSGSYNDLSDTPTIYSSAYIGTTNLDFARSSASQTLNGVSIDGSVTWTNPTPAPGDPWRTLISADNGNANIVLYSGLPGFGTSVNWTFDTTGVTFPDTTVQTTAAVAQIQSDWDQTNNASLDYIKNKPTIPDIGPIQEVFSATTEPMGHADKSQSTISFNDSTRTFTISPVSGSFDVWVKGVKFVISTSRSVTIPNTSGLYYIYFDAAGALQYQTTFFDWPNQAPTAYVYWNSGTGKAPMVADERHGIVLDWQTHEYLHRTRGAAIADGFGASNYILNGAGNLDTHIQLDIASGTFFDEDLEVNVVSTNTPTANTWEQDLTGPSQIPIFYLSGTTGWVRDDPTTFPLKRGSARPVCNLNTAGTWSTPDIDNNKFGVTFIIATNNINYPVMGVIGQSQHANRNDAEALEWNDLELTGFPVVEFRPLYKVVYETRNSYTNTPKARIVSVWDLRSFTSVISAAASFVDANALSGTVLAPSVVTSSLTSVGTLNGVTSNAATAFIAGAAAESGVALEMPREGALRNLYNGLNNMYFDVSIGGSTNGQFQFRSSSSFTNVLTMSPTAFNVNTNAVVTAKTASFGRLAWNSAIDTELTIDDYRFRVSNQGGIYPQIISNVSGQTKNSAWTAVAAISGQAVGQAGSTGNLVPNNAWVSLYSFAAMNAAGDTVTVTLQDKNLGRIYRVTFMRSDDGATTGYNIIAERLL